MSRKLPTPLPAGCKGPPPPPGPPSLNRKDIPPPPAPPIPPPSRTVTDGDYNLVKTKDEIIFIRCTLLVTVTFIGYIGWRIFCQ